MEPSSGPYVAAQWAGPGAPAPPKLSGGALAALIIGAIVALFSLGVSAMLGLLIAFAADGCTEQATRGACENAMGVGAAVEYLGLLALLVIGVVVLCMRRLRPAIRIATMYVIVVLAPALVVIAFIIAASGQPAR